jgi:hypothetical protein
MRGGGHRYPDASSRATHRDRTWNGQLVTSLADLVSALAAK